MCRPHTGNQATEDKIMMMLTSSSSPGPDKPKTLLFRHTREDAFAAFDDEVLICKGLSTSRMCESWGPGVVHIPGHS